MLRNILTCVALVLCTVVDVRAAGKPNGNNQERRDNQRVSAARDDVAEAEKKLAEESQDVRAAAAELAKANAAASAAAQEVAETRAAAERRHGERAGIDKVLEAATAAQAELDAVAKPILTALRASEKYLAARKAADDVRAKESPSPRDLEIALEPNHLERDALAADAAATKLKAALAERLEHVAAARAAVRNAVESDSELLKSLRRLDAAKQVVDKAEQKLSAERAKALAAVRKLAQEKAQLQQAIANDKKNDGNNKKPLPKKKKDSPKKKAGQ